MAFLIDTKLLADNIKYFREKQSYTVSQLASLAGVTTLVVQALESGTYTPADGHLSRIAGVLKVKPEQLVMPRPHEIEYYESC